MTTDPTTAYTAWGHPHHHLLGRGMEGTVHALGPGPLGDHLIAKAWHHRTETDLRPLQAFHDELAAQHPPFATPRILHIRHHHDTTITLEPHLPGTPLDTLHRQGTLTRTQVQDATTHILNALAHTTAGPATKALTALDEAHPLWRDHTTWPQALTALIDRRTTRFAHPLRAALPDLDTLHDALRRRLSHLPTEPPRIVHGDLCPPNILATDQGTPTAVLDWGFLTTAADPLFDTATAAGFHDMYGPHAREHDDALLTRWTGTSGPERERALLYRAAYALISANAYSDTGEDGHFLWCVRTFERADVRAVLGV